MKNNELHRFSQGLLAVGQLAGTKFAYAVSRNTKFVASHLKAISKTVEPSKDFIKFDKARIELCKQMAVKDDDGNPTIEEGTGSYILEDKDKFEIELNKLRKKFEIALKTRDKQEKVFKEYIEEESGIELYMIQLKFVPESITPSQMTNICEMVEE